MGLIVKEISSVDVKCVKVTGTRNIGLGNWSRYPQSPYIRRSTTQGLVVVGLIVEEISNVDVKCVKVWSAKYRSRSLGKGTCRVSTSRRSTMQGLAVERLTVEEIWNVDVNCVKVTGARNVGQVTRSRYLPSQEVRVRQKGMTFESNQHTHKTKNSRRT